MMGNMDSTQRSQMERIDLGDARSTRLLSTRSRNWALIYMLLALPILGVLIYAAVAGIDNWWQVLVLAVIALTAVGVMIAISPRRRS
jgi:membrane protein YdbS with pleckstrin-like domain